MTRLRVAGSELQLEVRVEDRLIDVADDHDLGVPFSCRSATCGTCRVRVLCGGEAFSAAGDDEKDTLAAFDADPQTRLCCQLHITREVADIELEVVDD